MKIYADLHTHTVHSHGKGSVEDNVRAAAAKGLQAVAISEHGPRSAFWGVKGLETFKQIKKEVEDVKNKFPEVDVLTGAEANIISIEGKLDIPAKDLSNLDIAMAGLHLQVIPASFGDGIELIGKNLWAKLRKNTWEQLRNNNTKAVVEAVYRNRLDVITHPGFRIDIDTEELAKACAARGTAMEINTSHPHTTVEYLKIAKRAGAKFVIGSDAHSPTRVGDFALGISLAQKAGLTEDDILNAKPWKRKERSQRMY